MISRKWQIIIANLNDFHVMTRTSQYYTWLVFRFQMAFPYPAWARRSPPILLVVIMANIYASIGTLLNPIRNLL